MVVCISVAADDGAVVARSYAGYNNQKPSVASDNVYRPVNLSWNNTFKKVTAEEALEVKDGVLRFLLFRNVLSAEILFQNLQK